MKHTASAIGLDVGGTKIAGGAVTADGVVLEQMKPIPTPAADQQVTLHTLTRIVAELRGRHPHVEGVGVGTAGMVEWPEGRVRWAPNNAYRALPLRRLMEDASGLTTVVDNDANTAAWAEARLGRPTTDMAFLTIGTGVGGGLIINGELYRGRTGIGAEVGHITVSAGSQDRCSCGNIGCLEALASGTALERFGRAAAAANPAGAIAQLAGDAHGVTGEAVLAAARAGDPIACQLFEGLGSWLGVGIASLVTIFDFELIVVGGGLTAAGELILGPARRSFEQHVFARAHRTLPEIAPATLGAEAGWIGAALLALDDRVAVEQRRLELASCGAGAVSAQQDTIHAE